MGWLRKRLIKISKMRSYFLEEFMLAQRQRNSQYVMILIQFQRDWVWKVYGSAGRTMM